MFVFMQNIIGLFILVYKWGIKNLLGAWRNGSAVVYGTDGCGFEPRRACFYIIC